MSLLQKVEVNGRNAEASTGPCTPADKATVSFNAATHGVRAAVSRLYWESADCQRICLELTAEWQPATPTECTLVEQMAVAQAKLIRLERNMTHAFYQSEFMKMIGCEEKYTLPDSRVRMPDAICSREFDAQKLINGISQHIARLENTWHKALNTLQKLQNWRRKEAARPPAPCEKPATAAAPPQSAPPDSVIPEQVAKIDEQSQSPRAQIPRKGMASRTNEDAPADPGLALGIPPGLYSLRPPRSATSRKPGIAQPDDPAA